MPLDRVERDWGRAVAATVRERRYEEAANYHAAMRAHAMGRGRELGRRAPAVPVHYVKPLPPLRRVRRPAPGEGAGVSYESLLAKRMRGS